jgi:holo-[acyl-carrier protein] synthase
MSSARPGAVGIGVDILALPRFEAFLARSQASLGEIFTQQELTSAAGDGRRALYLATRWALKEAVLKALGTGWGSGVEWTDVEALGELCRPRITLRGSARQAADAGGGQRAVGSAASSGDSVIAMVALMPDHHRSAQ